MTTTTAPRPDTAATPPPSFTPPSRPDRSAAAITVGLVLVAAGVLALLGTLGVDIPLRVLAPTLLVVLGLGVVVSAVRGETSGGILALAVVVGVFLTIGAVASAVLDVPFRGAIGERSHHPTATADLQDEYHHLVGDLVVDLRDVDLGPGTTTVAVTTVLGQVDVQVPDDVAVTVHATTGGGTATVFGVSQDGVNVRLDEQSENWASADQRLELEVGVGLGEVTVTR